MLRDTDVRPIGVGKRCAVPAWFLAAGVVDLAAVNLGRENRTRRPFPTRIGCDDFASTVGVHDFQLRKQADTSPVMVAMRLEPDLASVPSAADDRPDGVLARVEQITHVIGLVLKPRAITRPSRCEHVPPDTLAVDVDLVQAMARDVEPGGTDVACQSERAPEIG